MRIATTWVLGAALLSSGCGVADAIDGSVDAAIAEFEAEWSMTPDVCGSGEHQGFFGVDLGEGTDTSTLVRVLLDPKTGYTVGTNVPETNVSYWLDADDGCEVFDVEVVRQNSRVNNIWNLAGHAIVECQLPGVDIHMDLEFGNCH